MYLSKRLTRVFCLAICFLLILPTSVFAAQPANDYSGHWSGKQVESFVEKGFVSLYSDGSFKPDAPITRADFAAIANKAFALKEKDNTGFKDVKPGDTYYYDFLIARKAGYITGTPEGMALPKGYMTRQEYAVMIARLLKLDTKKDINAADKFADAGDMPAWSKGSIGAVARLGYMNGEPGNKFNPKGYVTRGQAVAVLERCYPGSVKVAYNKAGTYSEKLIDGNAAINVPNVKLENTTITGSLTIGEGVGSGNVTLKNVVVKGDTIVKGGGLNSIIIEDSQIKNIIIIKEDNKVRIVAVGSTSVERVDMQSGGKLEEQGTSGKGFGYITIAENVDPNEPVILKGSFESVQVQADGVKLDIESGSIARLDVASTAANTQINLAAGTSVAAMSVNAAAAVTGKGAVGAAQVNVQGATITAPVTTMTKAPGVTVVTTAPAPTPAPAPATSGSSGSRSGGGGGSDTPAIPTVKAVSANPTAGAVNAGTQVALSTETAGADIYYTLDGTEPTASSTKYTGPITIDKNKTIKAIGIKSGMSNSAVATFVYAVLVKVEAGKPVTFDNGTQIDGLPAGASIAASEVTVAPKSGIAAAGKAMDFTFDFSGPVPEGVALKLPTTSADAGLSYYNTARDKWELQEGSAVITEGDKKFVKATVTHFSTYGPIIKSAQLVADSITKVDNPVKDAVSLTLPAVPEGFSIAIANSSNTGVIGLDGKITPPANETKVNVRLKVTRTSDSTTAETAAMEVVVPARTPVLSAIGAISGTPKVGVELTAGALTPAGATASYQWQICDSVDGTYTDIAGATTNKYTAAPADLGKYIRVTATGTGDYSGTVISTPSGVVSKGTQDPPTGLKGVAPTTYGGSDGKITGTAPGMEFKAAEGIIFIEVTGLEITGLKAGDYAVRYVATPGYQVGFVQVVTVPEGPKTPVTAIGAVSGTPKVGVELTAGALTPVAATASYQWQICDTLNGTYTNIDGETTNKYTPVAGDAGKYIRVVATGSGSYTGTVTSEPTSAVAFGTQNAPTGLEGVAPAIYGGSDGKIIGTTAGMEYTLGAPDYNWISVAGSEITGLKAGDYAVRYAAIGGYLASEELVVTVPEGPKVPVTAIAAISGTPKVGVELTAGALTPAAATASYQWQICDTVDGTYADIAGATTNKYTPVAGDAGKYIRVTATGTGSYTGTVTSDPTSAVANADQAAPAGLAGVAPTAALNDGKITGTTTDMEYKLSTADDSTYAACGNGATTGLAEGTYSVRYAAKLGYNVGAAAEVEVPAYVPPVSVTAIAAISGTPKVGVELTAGALTPAAATASYQWQICDTVDGTYADIAGATTNKYKPVAGDAGKYIRVTATGTGSYIGAVISDPTSAVANADQAAPAGLAGVAPTAALNDGKITGTTTDMEYKLSTADDSTYATCGDGATTGLAEGTYSVRYAAKLGYNVGATAEVVVPAYVPVQVTGVTLDKTSAGLEVGTGAVNKTQQLTATIAPANATNKNVTWSSSKESIAVVGATGLVTAVGAGEATITVTTEDGGYTATCAVTVTDVTSVIPVEGITLDKTFAELEIGTGATKTTQQLTATVAPLDATNKNVTWLSSDTNVATVDNTGLVTAVGAGKATITVTTLDGSKTATCTVIVKDNFLSYFSAGFTENTKELTFTVKLALTEAIDTSKLKYMTSQNGDYYHYLTGTYTKVANTEPLNPGQYFYQGSASETTICLKLTDTDADAVKSLPGYGNEGELVNANHDRLAADSGWYPGADPGIKVVTINNLIFVMNNSSLHTVNAVYTFDSNGEEVSSTELLPSAGNGSGFTVLAGPRAAKIVLYEGSYASGVTPTNGNMAIAQITPDIITNGITLVDSDWVTVDETNFGQGGGSETVEIYGFDGIANMDAGTAGAAVYADAAAVQAALPATVTANGEYVSVPVVGWTDTDTYNPAKGGFYTFTAILGEIPAGFANTGDYTATVEVVVATEYDSVGTLSNSIVSVANGTMEADAKAALDTTVEVIGKCGEKGTAGITWTLVGYNGSVPGDYTATGALSLPTAWIGTPGTVTATVSVKEITYASVKALANDTVSVPLGSTEEYAEGALDTTVEIVGTNEETGTATITWTIASYNGNVAADYTATGLLTLPDGWTGTPDEVTAIVRVQGITYSYYDSLSIGSATVPVGTTETDAKSMLNSTVAVYGTSGETGTATIAWTIAGYDGNIEGDYTATGTLALPGGWSSENPVTVSTTVTVQAIQYSYTEPLTKATVAVTVGATETDAKAALDSTVGIVGTNGEKGTATITWTIESYSGETPGNYTATGTLTLPAGWAGAPDPVNAIVKVVVAVEYASMDTLANGIVTLAFGSSEAEALATLDPIVGVHGTLGESDTAAIVWSIASYDGQTAGNYTATGTLVLPDGWTGDPGNVSATVSVATAIGYSSMDALANTMVYVGTGTSEWDALDALDSNVLVYGTLGETAYASISWVITGYDGQTPGNYTATGTLVLPDGWTGDPGNVSATVSVKVIGYASMDDLMYSTVQVDYGTTEEYAIYSLESTVGIYGTSGETAYASISWVIAGYDGQTAGEYAATGTLELPTGWSGDPGNVSATVVVMGQ